MKCPLIVFLTLYIAIIVKNSAYLQREQIQTAVAINSIIIINIIINLLA